MTSRSPRRYEPDYMKCECGNEEFKIEFSRPHPDMTPTRRKIYAFAVCTKCKQGHQI